MRKIVLAMAGCALSIGAALAQEAAQQPAQQPPGGRLGTGLPGLLSVRFPGRRAEDLLLLLDRYGVACSAGSACASGAVTPSHVLVAMGQAPAEALEQAQSEAQKAIDEAGS